MQQREKIKFRVSPRRYTSTSNCFKFFYWRTFLSSRTDTDVVTGQTVAKNNHDCGRNTTRLGSARRRDWVVRTRSPSWAHTPTSTASSSTSSSLPSLVSSRPSRLGAPIHRLQHTKHTREIVKHGRRRRAIIFRVRRQRRHSHALIYYRRTMIALFKILLSPFSLLLHFYYGYVSRRARIEYPNCIRSIWKGIREVK